MSNFVNVTLESGNSFIINTDLIRLIQPNGKSQDGQYFYNIVFDQSFVVEGNFIQTRYHQVKIVTPDDCDKLTALLNRPK